MSQKQQKAERMDEKEMKETTGGTMSGNMGATPHQDIAGSGYQQSDEQWQFGDVFQDGQSGAGSSSGSGSMDGSEGTFHGTR